jgi:hypothetical protein
MNPGAVGFGGGIKIQGQPPGIQGGAARHPGWHPATGWPLLDPDAVPVQWSGPGRR